MHLRSLPLTLAVLSLAIAGCDSGNDPFAGGGSPPGCTVVGGVCLDDLLERPQAIELANIRAQWSERGAADVVERSYTSVMEETQPDGSKLAVLEGRVDGDLVHYGLVRVPPSDVTARPSILLVLQESDGGVSEFDLLQGDNYSNVEDQFMQVLVAYRGEELSALGNTFASSAPPSVYDFDVDDALGLLRAAIAEFPASERNQVSIYGFGRGATVGLLAALRTPMPSGAYEIQHVVDLAGFADYQVPSFRTVVTRLLDSGSSSFPGSAYLAREIFDPLREGNLSLSDARLALIRRSPNVFIDAYPSTLIQHGTSDSAVDVVQSDWLFSTLLEDKFGSAFYGMVEGVGHDELPNLPTVQNAVSNFLLGL